MTVWSTFGRRLVALPGAGSFLTALGVSAFIQTLLDDADAATARTTLGAVGLTGDETVAGVKTFSSNPVVSGGGIQFPATQVPSADANALDDYEEGTWTPTIAFGGAAVGITYGTRTATYTKVGRLVHAGFDITLTAKGSSTGTATIEALPFSIGGTLPAASFSFYQNLAGLTGALMGSVGGTAITLRQHAAATVATVTDANFTATTRMIGSVTYHV
jgi:hypothetical protein